MIEDKKIAKKVSELLIEYSNRLNESLLLVQEKCSDEDFQAYRKAISFILGEMLIRIQNPLYQQHPDIKPDDLYVPGVSPKSKHTFKEMLEMYKSGDKDAFKR